MASCVRKTISPLPCCLLPARKIMPPTCLSCPTAICSAPGLAVRKKVSPIFPSISPVCPKAASNGKRQKNSLTIRQDPSKIRCSSSPQMASYGYCGRHNFPAIKIPPLFAAARPQILVSTGVIFASCLTSPALLFANPLSSPKMATGCCQCSTALPAREKNGSAMKTPAQ